MRYFSQCWGESRRLGRRRGRREDRRRAAALVIVHGHVDQAALVELDLVGREEGWVHALLAVEVLDDRAADPACAVENAAPGAGRSEVVSWGWVAPVAASTRPH